MQNVVYTFAPIILAIPWCVGSIALAAGIALLLRPVSIRLKIMLFVVAAFALGLVGPSMQKDRIEITPESFLFRTGLWWSPNEHRFLFQDATTVEVTTIPDIKGRQRKYMRVTLKDGSTDDVPMGDLFRQHEEAIL